MVRSKPSYQFFVVFARQFEYIRRNSTKPKIIQPVPSSILKIRMENESKESSKGSIQENEGLEISDKERIRKLEAQVFQLKNVIIKLTGQTKVGDKTPYCKSKKGDRPFDFKMYKKRHVLLHVSYFGWNYHGFAVQETTGKTIESELFQALLTTKLIESRETSNYHRCGRTDKGVSAFNQVISIDLRTNLLEGLGVKDYEGCTADSRIIHNNESTEEIDFCKIINANLPPEIQIVGWAPCSSLDYSARFNCVNRTYKYFFPRGDLNLELMNEGGSYLVGGHDFRNFCKMDVGNGVTDYHRRITSVAVDEIEYRKSESNKSPYDMCVLTIAGKAFLWHQIRCIVAVLFRIGSGKETPDVVNQLLDVDNNPCRPQYTMASEVPLNLFHVVFDDENITWNYDTAALTLIVRQVQTLWTEHSVKASMLREVLNEIESIGSFDSDNVIPVFQAETLVYNNHYKRKQYVPLMEMPSCPTLEDKLGSSAAKRRKNVIHDKSSNKCNGTPK